jgi:hypothetical protein
MQASFQTQKACRCNHLEKHLALSAGTFVSPRVISLCGVFAAKLQESNDMKRTFDACGPAAELRSRFHARSPKGTSRLKNETGWECRAESVAGKAPEFRRKI